MEVYVLGASLLVALIAVIVLLRGRSARAEEAAPVQARSETPRPEDQVKVNWLVGTAGEHAGKTFHIGYRTITIGREPTNFVQITDEKSSRKHCQITPREGFLQVVDMRSANGTQINGTPITQGRLNPGDELRIGSTAFVYERTAAHASDDSRRHKRADPSTVKATVAQPGGGLTAMVRAALRDSQGDIPAAAATLGVSPDAVQRLIEKQGIDPQNP